MQFRPRFYQTQRAQLGKREQQENDYISHGTRTLITSLVVATGEVIGDLGATRTSVDLADHLDTLLAPVHEFTGCDWVMDNLNTHWSLDVCRDGRL